MACLTNASVSRNVNAERFVIIEGWGAGGGGVKNLDQCSLMN